MGQLYDFYIYIYTVKSNYFQFATITYNFMHSELSHTVGIYIPSDVSCADYETYKIVLYTVLISAVDGEILLLPVRVRRFENARTLLSILTLGQILIFVLLQSGLWRPMKTIWKRTFTTNSSSFTNC